MKALEVHNMNSQELVEEEQRLRRRLFDLRAQAVTENLKNANELKAIRKDVARILTERQQRLLKEKSAASPNPQKA